MALLLGHFARNIFDLDEIVNTHARIVGPSACSDPRRRSREIMDEILPAFVVA
jgi:hypothetical protein